VIFKYNKGFRGVISSEDLNDKFALLVGDNYVISGMTVTPHGGNNAVIVGPGEMIIKGCTIFAEGAGTTLTLPVSSEAEGTTYTILATYDHLAQTTQISYNASGVIGENEVLIATVFMAFEQSVITLEDITMTDKEMPTLENAGGGNVAVGEEVPEAKALLWVDTSGDPEPIADRVGNLEILKTQDKTNIVNALNEVASSSKYAEVKTYFEALEDTQTFAISFEFFNPAGDAVTLSYEGLELYEGVNYTREGALVTLLGDFVLTAGKRINIAIRKNIMELPDPGDMIDGSMLQTGSLIETKLSVNLQEKINRLNDVLNYGIATTEEARAGTSDVKYMTPQKTMDTVKEYNKILYNGSYYYVRFGIDPEDPENVGIVLTLAE
jgi:hypothetical protein